MKKGRFCHYCGTTVAVHPQGYPPPPPHCPSLPLTLLYLLLWRLKIRALKPSSRSSLFTSRSVVRSNTPTHPPFLPPSLRHYPFLTPDSIRSRTAPGSRRLGSSTCAGIDPGRRGWRHCCRCRDRRVTASGRHVGGAQVAAATAQIGRRLATDRVGCCAGGGRQGGDQRRGCGVGRVGCAGQHKCCHYRP
jgi:hypothetical protein